MHAAVEEALRTGINATRAGVTGEEVYKAAIGVIEKHGWKRALPPENPDPDFCSMQHGLGHGVGLEVHEPPLLDMGGPALIAGDALTIEPGLYHATLGGIRIEDLVITRDGGCENLNSLPYTLSWG
jgi:Xaa-Pro aminopeptidase